MAVWDAGSDIGSSLPARLVHQIVAAEIRLGAVFLRDRLPDALQTDQRLRTNSEAVGDDVHVQQDVNMGGIAPAHQRREVAPA